MTDKLGGGCANNNTERSIVIFLNAKLLFIRSGGELQRAWLAVCGRGQS